MTSAAVEVPDAMSPADPTAHISVRSEPSEAPPTTPGHVGPVRVVVDLDAIADNVAALREHAGGAPMLAVVKGDAYGHGLVPVARAAHAAGAAWLGTAQLSEALALRAAGLAGPVLSWLHAPGADFGAALRADIDLGVSAPWALEEIEAAARATGRLARLHLKIDTGLARNGAFGPPDAPAGPDRARPDARADARADASADASADTDRSVADARDGREALDALGSDARRLIEAAAAAQDRGHVRVVGLMSHFASSDCPADPANDAQQEVFDRAVAAARAAGLQIEVRHMANSAAVLTRPGARYDLVRPGLAMYGLSPVPDLGDPTRYGLRPAMRLEVDVALVKGVPAGQGVSYGHTYRTDADTHLALLPMGYADGLPRHASGVGPVLVGGRRHTISGRVCMDQVVVDLRDGSAPQDRPVRAGDVAVLFGDGRTGAPTAQDWAEAIGTISYEIVTRLSGRLPRVYVGGRGVEAVGEAGAAHPAQGAR